MQAFEKLGVFYLGKTLDAQSENINQEYVLYDSKDLVTHAVCVGMTGSGKTGLCISLLEEAAIDGIPALVIDPKGDLSDLLLTFPHLSAEEFRPWICEDEARARSVSPEEFARSEAERWRRGLQDWEQDGERIQRLRDSADFVIYTPGSSAGLPVSVASSFDAPRQPQAGDPEVLRERITTTASGLLALLGIQADPLKSREHILVSKLLEYEWGSNKGVTLGDLIQMIQSPPLERVGVFDLESFYPAEKRTELAMMLNNLLAAPGFGAWLEGDPLDIGRMLHTDQGKPRICIFSIAHLSDAERMFFVTLLLSQTLGWMRSQPGTTSLRALLYMDEIFGYFPPVAEPPSKRPLLTLLKQARAFGFGIVLATQNPVDLDYKGLANAGTWFIGRLQTEGDRERLLEGLSGTSASVGGRGLDRSKLAELIANLRPRAFLMQNAHEERPVLFSTRWALCYLPGPLTRVQIKQLTIPRTTVAAAGPPAVEPKLEPASTPEPELLPAAPRPLSNIRQFFMPAGSTGGQAVYRPFLCASAKLQLVNNKFGINSSQVVSHALELQPNMTAASWDQAVPVTVGIEELTPQAPGNAAYRSLPTTILEARRLQVAQRGYLDFVARQSQLTLWKSESYKVISRPGESERDFRIRLQQLCRERRDFELERLRQRYAAKVSTLQQRLRRVEQQIQREQQQYSQQKVQTAISLGATLLGAFIGRKTLSIGTLGRATTATRQASRVTSEKEDVQRALEERDFVQQQLDELDQQLRSEADQLAAAHDPQSEALQEIVIRPAKSDILLQAISILWMP
jgi:hypothetical protein